jgi:hypothetical protein
VHQLYKKYPVAESTIPYLKIRLSGHLSGQAPARTGPIISVKLNGTLRSVVHIPDAMHWEEDDDSGDDDDSTPPVVDEFENQLDALLDDAEQDQLDGPDWAFDKEETVVVLTSKGKRSYIFCGAPHRKQILRLHTTHICQHPFFHERLQNESWTAEKIRANAVQDLYLFCEQRGLREAWAYLWANWYSPQRWKLWARSSSPEILSRLRTTMGTENFWRQLKGNQLKDIPRPRLDQLVYILINDVTRDYYVRLAQRSKSWGAGTSKPLSPFQTYFKTCWKKLEGRKIGNHEYTVDVQHWKCNCGQQKFAPFHLCKHLVHAVGPIPELSRFWQEIRRRRRTPLYIHPLIQKGDLPDRGSITDGDDTDSDTDDVREAFRPAKRRRPATDEHEIGGGEGSQAEFPSSSCPGSDIELDEVSIQVKCSCLTTKLTLNVF